MSIEIKVSVVMPVYNAGEYLIPCLDSVQAQTLKEIEVICVDDGSTDGSGEVLEEYAGKDSRFQVFHQKNQYAGCARNLGLSHAAGKYVVFWDADDLFEPSALEKMYDQCEKDQAEICVCGGYRMSRENDQRYQSEVYLMKEMLPDTIPFGRKDIPEYIFNFTTNVPWNKMFLKEFVLKNHLEFQALRQANDVYFSMTALFLSSCITVVPEPLVTYRMDNTSSLTGKASANRYCTMEAFEAVWNQLKEDPEFNEKVRRSFANRAFYAMLGSLRSQWDFEVYRELYELYKNKLLPEYGITGQEKGFLYNEYREQDLERMLRDTAEQFLLEDFRHYERLHRTKSGQLGEAKKELRRLKKVENSHSYKLGKKITYLPGKLIEVIHRQQNKEEEE